LDDYRRAWEALVEMALTSLRSHADALLVQSALAVVALGRNAVKLGALIIGLDCSELDEILNDKTAWRDLYTDAVEQIVGREPRQKQL
jgi:DNA-binding ferritin-like protein (Dps family)